MGRSKTKGTAREKLREREKDAESNESKSADIKIQEMLKELHQLVKDVQEEREKGDHTLSSISKTHERMQAEQQKSPTGKGLVVNPYYRTKLKGMYSTAMQDAEREADLLGKALEKIREIKTFRSETDGGRSKPIMRRGVLMKMLTDNANSLPLWVGKPGEKPPPLCGAVPAEPNYIASPRDKVAARVKGDDGEENWILAFVVAHQASTGKYDVDDIDAEEGKQSHTLSKRRVVPLPKWKTNPETDQDALFPKETLVLALYPQTTCFYRALIHDPPKRPSDDYSVLFEDTTYASGYSPPLPVAQRYVIACKDDKKK